MGAEINYKSKYVELRSKYMGDLDMAFRLGFEQGQQQAQMDQMAQQQQQQQEMEQAAQGQPGQEGAPQEGVPGQEAPQDEQNPMSANPQGSELDQHIAKLEEAISKSEIDPKELKKTLDAIKMDSQLKKSAEAIKGIAKALHKPKFKLGQVASHNMSSNSKQAVSLQHKIVNDVMAKMEAEEKKAAAGIKGILNIDGLTKKE